jgi:hypothetical protein
MLRHLETRWDDLDDLLPAVVYDLSRVERRAAAPALLRAMLNDTVGTCRQS